MIDEFGLNSAALLRLARIIGGADTGQLELTPQSPGLLAASLGYSRMYRDDLENRVRQWRSTMPATAGAGTPATRRMTKM